MAKRMVRDRQETKVLNVKREREKERGEEKKLRARMRRRGPSQIKSFQCYSD